MPRPEAEGQPGGSTVSSPELFSLESRLRAHGRQIAKLGKLGRLFGFGSKHADELTAAQRIARNKEVGDTARDRIAGRFPNAEIEQTLDTPLGPRRIDVLVGKHAFESKVGRTS